MTPRKNMMPHIDSFCIFMQDARNFMHELKNA